MSERVDGLIEDFKKKLSGVGAEYRKVVEELDTKITDSAEYKDLLQEKESALRSVTELRTEVQELEETIRDLKAAELSLETCQRCDRNFFTVPGTRWCTPECQYGFTKIPHQEKELALKHATH